MAFFSALSSFSSALSFFFFSRPKFVLQNVLAVPAASFAASLVVPAASLVVWFLRLLSLLTASFAAFFLMV